MVEAEKLKTYDPKKFRAGYASIKRNGVHAIFDPKKLMAYSRTPRPIHGLSHLNRVLRLYPYPLVGELTVPGVDFETGSGMIRSHDETPEAQFNIFNAIVPGVKFKDRLDSLKTFQEKYLISEDVFLEEMHYVDNTCAFDRFYESAVAQGEEGVCWISPNHVYQPGKRGWSWMKRIPMLSIEARVKAILPGTEGKKYENSLGRMVCTFINAKGEAKEFKVGIFKGQTDEWRQGIYDNSAKYLEQMITIEFKAFSKYGIPTQPRFKAFRWDL